MNEPTRRVPRDPRLRQARLRAQALALSGGSCAFPDCTWSRTPADPRLLEVAHIQALMQGGPRYDPEATPTVENALVLCANHHRLVDGDPTTYSTAWLLQRRAEQVKAAAQALKAPPPVKKAPSEGVALSVAEVLEYWVHNRAEANEEHWQRFIAANPICLAATLQGRAYTLLGKCYVGGKSVRNRGGNEVDFLASHRTNVSLIEIKTPTAKLFGARYRGNTHLMGKDVHGGVLQVLESRRSLLEEIAHLNHNAAPGQLLAATAPYCVLIVGDTEAQEWSTARSSSFELFRQSQRDVSIITFDELFDGLRMLSAAMPGL